MASGVYCIKNKVSGKVYVGESIDIRRRWDSHRADLEKGDHYNEILRSAWLKYGQDAFEWLIIEECDRHLLREREAHWMREMSATDRKKGYNIRTIS